MKFFIKLILMDKVEVAKAPGIRCKSLKNQSKKVEKWLKKGQQNIILLEAIVFARCYLN